MKRSVLTICIILALAVFTSAFAASTGRSAKWWPGERPTPKAAGALSGEITGITETTLTVQTENDGAPIFTLNKDTQVKGQKTSVADLKVGDKVVVSYTTLPDGNVWAKIVTVPKQDQQPAKTGSAFGRVTAVSATAITITTEKNGEQTFTVTDKTQVRVKGVKSAIDQVKLQDPVIVAFELTNAGPVARLIRVLAEGVWPNLSGSVMGKVSAIDAASITVQTEKLGPQTFSITEKTRFAVYGQKATIDQIKVGANAHVGYSVLDDATRVANTVAIPIPAFTGKIVSVGEAGFVLAPKTQQAPITITVTPQTRITTHTYTGTLADLKAGYGASVRGIPADNAVNAIAVLFSVPEIRGVVQSAAGSAIVVKTLNQRLVTVTGTDATAILVRPRTAPNFPGTPADVKPGVAVNIGGHNTGRNTMTALWIDLLVP